MTTQTTNDEFASNLNELAKLAELDGAVLRAQIERAAADCITALADENQRLRELLQEIADTDDAAISYLQRTLEELRKIVMPQYAELRNKIDEALKEKP